MPPADGSCEIWWWRSPAIPPPRYPGLTRAIAQHWHLDVDPLTADPAQPPHA
ncbi:hypothetical protein [Leptolyngbya sp. O-77]|uniref:hypothetical protein n=1 Tax=Leptolyngbya sp. O-77 TaxID=1080068 RepID=UPI000AC0817E